MKSIDMVYCEINNGVRLPRVHMMTEEVLILSIDYEHRLEMKWFLLWMFFMDIFLNIDFKSNKKKKEIDRQTDR